MRKVKTVRDIETAGKRVFLRVDFNVPLDKEGNLTDDTRITAALPTVNYLLAKGAKVILASHLSRPKGGDLSFSLKPIAADLAQKLGCPVTFMENCIGPEVETAVTAMREGSVVLLENVRFHPGEESNDAAFGKALARLAQVYVNDAFGTAHRAHASIVSMTRYLPVKVAGLLMEKELTFLGEKTVHAARPFVVILGGAKVSDKIEVLDALLDKADIIMIGGAMTYTFYLAKGFKVGKSMSELDKITVAEDALRKAMEQGIKLLLPEDSIITDRLDLAAGTIGELNIAEGDIPDSWVGVDIGPKSVRRYEEKIASAKTILWNGPMGIFEIEACSKGTSAIAAAVAANTHATSIVGGGDSVKAIKKGDYGDKITFMSTGGGASLEFLKKGELPGIAVLDTL